MRVYKPNMLDEACARVSLGTFERKPLSQLRQMAREAGCEFEAGHETKRQLAKKIMEKEKPLHMTAAGRAEVERLARRWEGDEEDKSMWFMGEVKRGELEMRACSRKEWEE